MALGSLAGLGRGLAKGWVERPGGRRSVRAPARLWHRAGLGCEEPGGVLEPWILMKVRALAGRDSGLGPGQCSRRGNGSKTAELCGGVCG